jgi:CRP/FNR family transcriptional regulator, cyclic AMP receptor protein
MDVANTTKLLENISLFQGISKRDLYGLSRRVEIRKYRSGDLIFSYGDVGSSMYIVAKGTVNIYLPIENSTPLSLKDLGCGEHFGELSLFDDEPRSASAVALAEVDLIELTRETLWQYLERCPHTAIAILQTLSTRLRETNALLSTRATKNLEEEFEKQLKWSDKLADRVAALNGSWTFIIILIAVTIGWVGLNSFRHLYTPFDPYPYVFFNLLLAILVALQGPLIVMSQNRQVLKDRTQAKFDYDINLKNEVNIETLLEELREFRLEANRTIQKPDS